MLCNCSYLTDTDDSFCITSLLLLCNFQGPSTTEKEFITSGMWGSFLTDQTVLNIPDGSVHTGGDELDGQSDVNGQGDSQFQSLNTLWGYFIQTYVDVAIPQLDYIAGMCMLHYKLYFKMLSVMSRHFNRLMGVIA